ncbi:MAG: hypothetical protein Q8K36_04200 [Alphaproteobacteria bacterium]|nr:hypothetical protein [Alphaproteobacteria bacterium]
MSKVLIYVFLCIQLLASEKVEEGWRYAKSLHLRVSDGHITTDFTEATLRRIHTPMAYMVDQSKNIYTSAELPDPATRMFAMFRFTPVLRDKEKKCFILDETKPLIRPLNPSAPEEVRLTTGYECVFVSGFLKYEDTKTKFKPDSDLIDARYGGVKKIRCFCSFTPSDS